MTNTIEDRSFGGKLLVPELVPINCHGKAPRTYIGNAAWDILRKHVYRRAGHCCEICSAQGRVEAHERYVVQGDTLSLVRLIALCPACHLSVHYGRAQAIGEGNAALAQIMKVNNWSREHALKVVKQAFAVWRSQNHITEVNFDIFQHDPVLSRLLNKKE